MYQSQNNASMLLTLSWIRQSCTWTGYRCYGDYLFRKNLARSNECMSWIKWQKRSHWSIWLDGTAVPRENFRPYIEARYQCHLIPYGIFSLIGYIIFSHKATTLGRDLPHLAPQLTLVVYRRLFIAKAMFRVYHYKPPCTTCWFEAKSAANHTQRQILCQTIVSLVYVGSLVGHCLVGFHVI